MQNFDNWGWVAGTGANVFVSNHDTERVWPFLWPSFVDDHPHVEFGLSQCLFAVKYVHFGHHILPVCQLSHGSGIVLKQYVAPIHMVHLPSCRATTSSTKTLEVQTAVRPHVPALSFFLSSPTFRASIGFPQAREIAQIPTKYRDGKGESIISDRDHYHDGANNDVQVLPAPLARYNRDGRIPESCGHCPAHALGFAVVPTDRLCSRYVPTPPFLVTEKA